MYQEFATLTNAHLTAKKSQCATLRDWAFIRASKKSLKDGKTYFVVVTYTNVGIVEDEPTTGNRYKVAGTTVQKFVPTFAV